MSHAEELKTLRELGELIERYSDRIGDINKRELREALVNWRRAQARGL